MGEVKYEQLYAAGKYEDSKKELTSVLNAIKNEHDVSKFVLASRLPALATSFHPHRLSLILEGNIVFLDNVILLLSHTKSEKWLNRSQSDYYMKIRALSSSGTVAPFTLFLNSLYNSLWLMWMTGIYHDVDRDRVCEMLEDCFRRVLVICEVQAVQSSDETKSELVLILLQQVVKSVIHLETVHYLQVIEISTLCLLLFLELKISVSKKYKSLVYLLHDTWLQIQAKYKSSTANKKIKSESKSINLFKYGLLQVNETTDYCIEKLTECLHITSCLWLFQTGCLKECADFLPSCSVSGRCCKFMCTYFHAYISQELEEHDLCQLYIKKLSCIQMSELGEIHFHVLKGQHEFSVKHVASAHSKFSALLHTKHSVSRGLFHILNNMSTTVHNILNSHDDNTECSAIVGKFIEILMCFHKFVTNTCFITEKHKYNLEEKFFTILHKGTRHEVEDVVYILGKEMLWIEVLHLSSENSYDLSSIASECYLDVICKYYQSDSSLQNIHQHYWIVIHEAIISCILCGKTDAAETMCQILSVQNSAKEMIVDQEIVMEEMYLIEEGIALLMLKAYVNIYKEKWENANNLLTRIKKVLIHLHFCTKRPLTSDVPSLLDAVTAKTYVLKSALQAKAGYRDDALQSCHRALVHNPGDDIVQDCLNITQKIGAVISIPQKRNSFPKRLCKSLTFMYLLTAKLPL